MIPPFFVFYSIPVYLKVSSGYTREEEERDGGTPSEESNMIDYREGAAHYGAKTVFAGVSFHIAPRERIGLVGVNGCGKTTLLKILAGKLEGEGRLTFRRNTRVKILEQDLAPSKETVGSILNGAFEEVEASRERLNAYELEMAEKPEELARIMPLYLAELENYQEIGGYQVEEKANRMKQGLKIPAAWLNRTMDSLSGGERFRVRLARALLEEPDLMLLDEPTNHLDLPTIVWLEEYLLQTDMAFLIVSHDRYFLDRIVEKVFELHPDHMEEYHGNYSYYQTERERRFLESLKHFELHQKKIQRMEAQIERFRIWGKMRDSEVMYKRAKELEKRLVKLEARTPGKPWIPETRFALRTSETRRSGKEVLQLKAICKSFEENQVLKDIDFLLRYQENIALLGRNGAGKSTLFKVILGELEPDAGEIRIGLSSKIAFLPQEIYVDSKRSILDYWEKSREISSLDARRELAQLGFRGDHVFAPMMGLSGGERRRLALGAMMKNAPNTLILDEPTNHLDLDAREILETELQKFTGTVLFASHDRYFIEKMADRLVFLEGGSLRTVDSVESAFFPSEKIVEKQSGKKKGKPIRKKSDQIEKRRREWEARIEELEMEIEELEQELNGENRSVEELQHLFEEKIKREEEWENLFGKLESEGL